MNILIITTIIVAIGIAVALIVKKKPSKPQTPQNPPVDDPNVWKDKDKIRDEVKGKKFNE